MALDNVKREIDELARTASSVLEFMDRVTRKLNERMLKYNWAGFYMISADDPNMLELGPFVGAMTPHTRIPLNQGICGAAASGGTTVVVDDVSKDSRYLACSLETKSEIVVPVFVRGQVVGELDIDSHFLSAFGPEDRALVEYCAETLGKFMEQRA
ncbi:MAG TPA: GAF domain-containing protein [Verrucomicrobiae bacterium]|jgi:L-methionine (R)-S-oxide reductase|nr:GAF domain-containing protein [Verrucomicrobiae bacterium]